MQRSSWEHCFEGRQQQLKQLKAYWQEVKLGKPKLVTILGETGLGKTRLAQEFFSYLSKDETEDPNGYWPANLEVGCNLVINPLPETINTEVEIPWLWWGMRFSQPDERNYVAQTSPFVNPDPNLGVHANPILRMRQQKEVERKAGITLTTVIADILSIGVYGSLLAVKDMLEDRKVLIKNSTIPIDAIQAKQLEEIVETTVKTLSLFLKPTETDAPTVPVVMLVDDAQWIDPVSFQALNILMEVAVKEKLPLLILCTHWQKEWNEYASLDIEQSGQSQIPPENLKQLGDVLNHQREGTSLKLPLTKLKKRELGPTVESALPGIGEANQQYLLTQADGNPRALEEMIRLMLSDADLYFQNGDVSGELSKKGQKFLSKIHATDIYWLVAKRFKKLEPQLRDLLSTGALIGSEFLKPLVVDLLVASEEHPYQHFDDLDILVSKAKNIHSLIQGKSKQVEEFQQNIYYSVALKFLKENDEDSHSELINVQHAVFQQWLKPEKYELLAVNEKQQLFELILNFACTEPYPHFSPKDFANAFDDITSQSEKKSERSFITYQSEKKSERSFIAAWWKKLLHMPHDWLLDFAVELKYAQRGLLTLLSLESGQAKYALPFFEKLTPRLDNTKLYSYSLWHLMMANIYTDIASIKDAADYHYNESISALSGREYYSNEEGDIRCLHTLYCGLAFYAEFILVFNGNTQLAQQYFKDALETAQIIEEMLEDDALLQVTLQSNMVDCHLRIGNLEFRNEERGVGDAVLHYTKALTIAKKIREDFGENYESSLQIAAIGESISDLYLNYKNDIEAAKVKLNKALQIRNELLETYGESPDLLLQISNNMLKLGDIALHGSEDSITDESFKAAEAQYKKALEIIRTVVKDYGATCERLEHEAKVINKLSKLYHSDSSGICVETLKKYISQELEVHIKIVNQFDDSYQARIAILTDYINLGEVNLLTHTDVKASEKHFKQAFDEYEKIAQKYDVRTYLSNYCAHICQRMAKVCEIQEKFEESANWKSKAEAQFELIRQYSDAQHMGSN